MTKGLGHWIGASVVGNNGQYTWVATGDHLSDNSEFWATDRPEHGSGDCVLVSTYERRFFNVQCALRILYVCQAI